MFFNKVSLLKLSFVCVFLTYVGVAQAKETITLGVLAYLPAEKMYQRYKPLVDYLDKSLVDQKVKLLPLAYKGDEVEKAIRNQEIDLLLTNPIHFITLRTKHELSGAILTQVVLRNGRPISEFGGVIFTRSDNLTVNELADISDKRIAAADARSLGGYQAQLYEVNQHNLSLTGDVSFLKKHDLVIASVIDGSADVGFVRTGVLEGLIQSGTIRFDQIKVLNQKQNRDFPFLLSTDIYPEWPLLALPQLSDRSIRKIASALLALEVNHPAAVAAGLGGFDLPADYLAVERIARALRLPPYDKVPEFTFSDVWTKHYLGISILLAAIVLIITLSVLLWRRNSQLVKNALRLRRAASVFSNAGEAIIITDNQGQIIDVNNAFEEMTVYCRDEVVGETPRILKSGSQNAALYEDMWQSLKLHGKWQGEIWNHRKDGKPYAVNLVICALKDKEKLSGYVGLSSDITQKLYLSSLEDIKSRAMQSALEGHSLSHILDNVMLGIEALNPGAQCSILLLDDSGKHLLGCSAPSLPKGYNGIIDGIEIGDGVGSCGTAAFRKERVIVEDVQQHPYWAAFKDLAAEYDLGSCWSEPIIGKKERILGTFAMYHSNPSTPSELELDLISKTARLVSLLIEVEQAENDLVRLATTDELTKLANRREFMRCLEAECQRFQRYQHSFSLCMLDLDFFKQINDQYGHSAGDEVLRVVASLIKSELRDTDLVGRLGGEEFGILLPSTALHDACVLAERIRLAVEAHTTEHGGEFLNVTTSIGVTSLNRDSGIKQASELLSEADRCLYYAKKIGRNCVSDRYM